MTTLRKDYDPNEIPLNSSAIHKLDDRLMELRLSEDMPGPGLSEVSEQSDFERRLIERERERVVAPHIRFQRTLNSLVYKIYASRRYQVGFAMVWLLSFALLVVSLYWRIDHIDDSVMALTELGQLETELMQVRAQWSAEKMKSLEDSVTTADQRRVFVDYRSLADWLREKGDFARQLGLEFSYTLGAGRVSKIEDMLEVPVVVSLRSPADATQTYLHVLEFLKRLVSTLWYVEIAEASLEGEGQGATSVNATLRVWVHGRIKVEPGNAE
ncbi:MAG: hypothetical protein AAF270_05905 [Pseudomonadota bacterium]